MGTKDNLDEGRCSSVDVDLNSIKHDSRSEQERNPGIFMVTSDVTGVHTERLPREIRRPETYTPSLSCSQKTVSLAGACFMVMVGMGFPFSVAALYVEMIDRFNAPRSQAAVIQSLTVGFLFGAGILSGAVVDRYGVRVTAVLGGCLGFLGLLTSWFAAQLLQLMITIGVITGMGSSLLYMSASIVVASSFTTGRRLAMPGLICAGGVGSIVFPELMDWLVEDYGLRGTLLLLSSVYLNTIVFGLLVTSALGTPRQSARKHIAEKPNQISLRDKLYALRQPVFIIYVLVTTVVFGCVNGLSVVLLDFIQKRGFPTEVGLNALLIFNSMNTVFRLVSGFFQLIPRVRGALIFSVWLMLCSSAQILLSFTWELSATFAVIITFSIGMGGLMGIFPYSILEFVGHELFPLALGLVGLLNGPINPVGAALMGLMYDLTMSYELPFLVYGIIGNCCALIIFLSTLDFKQCRFYKSRTCTIH